MAARNMTENEFECAICMDIFTQPYFVHPCQHIYCMMCVRNLMSSSDPRCPQCRSDIQCFSPAADIAKKMAECRVQCSDCLMMLLMKDMKQHKMTCSGVQRLQNEIASELSQRAGKSSEMPNRSTFKCPYCKEANLPCAALIEHCNASHKNNRKKVVCPVCASMPWADPTLKSSNFLQHLNLRHKFEYDTYVDYDQDDDAMLQVALQASLQDH